MTFEPPDAALVVYTGSIDEVLMNQLIDQMVEVSKNKPYMLFIFDVRGLEALSPAARKAMTSNGHRFPPRALAFFGGSFTTQVMHGMMDRASLLLGSKNRFTRHSPDEKSARAWATEMRVVLRENAISATK